MPASDEALERVIADAQERPLPDVVAREVRLPELPGKAVAVIGMRRSGKTWRLFDEMNRLVRAGVPRSRLLYVNLEDDRLGPVDAGDLDRILEIAARRDPRLRSERGGIFLDEIQAVPGWERFARRVVDTEPARLFLTGSSARMLSTEVATAFRGRSTTVEVLPFGVREAAVASGLDVEGVPGAARRAELDAFILSYLRVGGFPALRGADPIDRVQALQEYVDLVVLRDVAERHGAANLRVLRELVAAMFSANTKGFSVSRLHGTLVSQGWSVGKATLLTYVGHLVDAYLFFLVPIRTRSARQRTSNPRKVYAIDPGLAAAMYRGGAVNRGAQLENAVYLELRRRLGRLGDEAIAYVLTEGRHEVDFAVDDPVNGGPPALVQVCESLVSPEVRAREVRALMEAMAELGVQEATIVTLTEAERIETDQGTIQVVPARTFFLTR